MFPPYSAAFRRIWTHREKGASGDDGKPWCPFARNPRFRRCFLPVPPISMDPVPDRPVVAPMGACASNLLRTRFMRCTGETNRSIDRTGCWSGWKFNTASSGVSNSFETAL
jgi:hypothetical protein